jgi:hypothetical protein
MSNELCCAASNRGSTGRSRDPGWNCLLRLPLRDERARERRTPERDRTASACASRPIKRLFVARRMNVRVNKTCVYYRASPTWTSFNGLRPLAIRGTGSGARFADRPTDDCTPMSWRRRRRLSGHAGNCRCDRRRPRGR